MKKIHLVITAIAIFLGFGVLSGIKHSQSAEDQAYSNESEIDDLESEVDDLDRKIRWR